MDLEKVIKLWWLMYILKNPYLAKHSVIFTGHVTHNGTGIRRVRVACDGAVT